MKKICAVLLCWGALVACDRQTHPLIIIDSNLTRDQALAGSNAPIEILDAQELVTVQYIGVDGYLHQGQLVVHQDIVPQVQHIFNVILKEKFPVGRVVPIVVYDWDDEKSMAANNTSGFNYRTIARSKSLSHHARGLAIDINPMWNPVVYQSGDRILPQGAAYDPARAGTLYPGNPVFQSLIDSGFRWGGDYRSFKDYHHFEYMGQVLNK